MRRVAKRPQRAASQRWPSRLNNLWRIQVFKETRAGRQPILGPESFWKVGGRWSVALIAWCSRQGYLTFQMVAPAWTATRQNQAFCTWKGCKSSPKADTLRGPTRACGQALVRGRIRAAE